MGCWLSFPPSQVYLNTRGKDALQLVSQLSVAIEDFAISEDGRDPDIVHA